MPASRRGGGGVVVHEAGGIDRRLALAERGTVRIGSGGRKIGRRLRIVARQLRVAVDPRHRLHQGAHRLVGARGRPVGEPSHRLCQLAVPIGQAQLLAHEIAAVTPPLGRAMAQHQVGEVDVEGMRRHVGALGHEAHVAKRAGVHDGLVGGLGHAIHLAGGALVHQVEQDREAVAQIEAAPTGVTDVEHPLHLSLDGGCVVESLALPVERMTQRRLEAAFTRYWLVGAQ